MGGLNLCVASIFGVILAACAGGHEPPNAPSAPIAHAAADSPASKPTSTDGTGGSEANYRLAANAPPDRPFGVTESGDDQLLTLIAPYIREARATYPEAKHRFLAGLPPGETFFVTARLRDEAGHFEQSFIRVNQIVGSAISGSIASDVEFVRGYRRGDPYRLDEADIVDWLISKPDGSEEGNVVGKYLDTLPR